MCRWYETWGAFPLTSLLNKTPVYSLFPYRRQNRGTIFRQSIREQTHKQGNCLQTKCPRTATQRWKLSSKCNRTATQTNMGIVFTQSVTEQPHKQGNCLHSVTEQPHKQGNHFHTKRQRTATQPVTKGSQSYFSSHLRNWYTLKAHKKCSYISHLAIIERNPPTNLTSARKKHYQKKRLLYQGLLLFK